MKSKCKNLKSLFMSVAISFVALSASAKDHLYVKAGADGDGSSWSKAMGNLQQAVDSAAKKGVDVWVAKGVYKGGSSAVVTLKSNVSLYGGFAGTETSVSARDTAKNPTILDGDGKIRVISQQYDFADTASVVVDGFKIQNGNASSDGGGGAYLRKNTTLNNCILTHNTITSSRGTAIHSDNAKIKNCIICDNKSEKYEMTIYLYRSEMDSCVVRNNTAKAMSAIYASHSRISNTKIDGNKDGYKFDHPLFLTDSSELINCDVTNNYGANAGVCVISASLVKGCSISNNISTSYQVVFIESKSRIEDSKIFENECDGEIVQLIYSSSMDRCQVYNNVAKGESRILEIGEFSTLSNSLVYGNKNVDGSQEPIYLDYGSKMVNTTFVDNETGSPVVLETHYANVINSIIVGTKFTDEYTSQIKTRGEKNVFSHSMFEEYIEGDGNIMGSKELAAFVSPENGDYSLSEKSYCINRGEDTDYSFDLFGKTRKQYGATDLGAIESKYSACPALSEIVYVKEGSKGDGTSWNTAFGDVDEAVKMASHDGKKHQIWVAAGTYYGDTTLSTVVNLASGISLYGGFAGTETSLSARDIAKNPTILDGKDSRRVITQNYVFADTVAVVVDGFTIQNGFAVNGGGVYLCGNTTLNNCIVKNCHAENSGLAVYSVNSKISNSVICDNGNMNTSKSDNNVALYLKGGEIDSCIVKNNKAYKTSALEAKNAKVSNSLFEANESKAYHTIDLSETTMSGCKIVNNINKESNGYVIAMTSNSVVDGCLIDGNETYSHLLKINKSVISNSQITNCKTRSYTHLIFLTYGSSIINCTVADNESYYSTVYSDNGTIANSIVYRNKMGNALEPQISANGRITVVNCASDDDLTGENNIKLAKSNSGSDASQNYVCFINSVGGDYRLHATSSCIDKGIDSLTTAKSDLNGGARIYGKSVDLGAIEFDGGYVQMLDYSQVVCGNKHSLEATFDSNISKVEWEVDNAGKVLGFVSTSGSGKTIPSMQLYTTKNDIDTLTLKVTPYNKAGLAGTTFDYNYYVYPDFSKQKISIKSPAGNYVNMVSTNMTVEWDKLNLPVEVEKYELYVWKSTEKMPSVPTGTYLNVHSKYFTSLDNHTTYKYLVKAAIACDTVYSDTMQFGIDIPASLESYGNINCEFGSKLGEPSYLTRQIKGFELQDTISYDITGDDANDFYVENDSKWNALEGGTVKIFYNPTDSKKPISNATLTFKSGSKKTVYILKGLLANYYVFDAAVGKDAYRAGDTIEIKGLVTDAYGVPYEGKNLKITLFKNGSKLREFNEYSDANGVVSVKYASSVYESGVYSVGISLNGENSNGTYDEFNILGISCRVNTEKWLVQKGDTITGTLTVTNRSKIETSGIKVRAMSLADGCKIEFDSIDVLKGLESKTINFRVTGDKVTEGDLFRQSTFRVQTADNLTADFISYFYCEAPFGQIKVLPANIKEYVSKQNPKFIELLLCNEGIGESGKVTFDLPKDFPGMAILDGNDIESIKAGDTVKATLKMAYYEGAKLNTPIDGTIGINCENGKSTTITYSMEYTSESTGGIVVDVVDEYYYNTASKPHIAGAKVEIGKAFNNSQVVASGLTDSTGMVRLDSIPEGEYLLVVTADNHSSYNELITIQAGQTISQLAFISYTAVKYSWKVEKVEIEDKYELSIDAQFETNVPAPVVTASFPKGIPAREKFNPGDKDVAYLQVTNHGMIAAKDVKLVMPRYKGFKFTPDIDHVDSLPANYSMIVPITIERISKNIIDTLKPVVPDTIAPVEPDTTPVNPSTPGDGGGNNGGGSGVGGGSGNNNGGFGPIVDVPGGDSDDKKKEDEEEEDEEEETAEEEDDDCSLKIHYSFECGGVVLKEGYITVWPCITLPKISIGGGGVGSTGGLGHVETNYLTGGTPGPVPHYKPLKKFTIGTLTIGTLTIKGIPCNPCLFKFGELAFNCGLNLLGLSPKTFKYGDEPSIVVKRRDLAETADLFNLPSLNGTTKSAVNIWEDILYNDLDAREHISYTYTAVTELLNRIPILENVPFSCFDMVCGGLSCLMKGKPVSNCAEFAYDLIKDLSKSTDNGGLRSANVDSESEVDFYKNATPYLLAIHDLIEYNRYAYYVGQMFAEVMGGEEMVSKHGAVDFLGYAIDSISSGTKINIDGVKSLPVSDLSVTDMISIAERWNESVDAWSGKLEDSSELSQNLVKIDELKKNLDGITNFYQYVKFRGYDNMLDFLVFVEENIENHDKESVCASVKLQISQTMTMTREAFDGTLTVENGKETNMDAFQVQLEIRDEKGNLANDLFQINTQSLKNIAAVDGSSSLLAGKEATALFRFIPEKGAAPKTPVNYSFGGNIIYVESGDTVVVKMDPVTLTVNPSPDLQIDYFMQRNILGDDALTENRVEPSVPAALGVRIDNQGYGIAKNVKLETAQPEIVENNKGLLIDFAIIGSSLNGKDCNLGSENIDFGTIDAQSAKTGVWWLTSSLLGHFTKYEASVVHANSFGNPELSLVKGVAIHELIKTVDAYSVKEDGIVDFLVNDYNDGKDIPDAIYYSHGGKDTVNMAKIMKLDKDRVKDPDTIVKLTVTPSQSGWNYAQTLDPGNNKYEIQKVVRKIDGKEIPLSNVWTTFVDLPDSKEPVYVNRLHFLDYMTTLGESDYDVYYSIRKNLLEVTSITGIPENIDSIATPVKSVVVKFNRKIQNESFDYNDIELYCQGGNNLSDSSIVVTQIDDYSYSVNISSKTDTTGFYKIEINVDNIFDEKGYSGEFGMNAAWSQFIENKEEDTDDPIDDGKEDTDDDPEEDNPYDDFETTVEGINMEEIVVYVNQNNIYVKSAKDGMLDIYDVLSRLVAKDAQYGVGVTNVATLPKGVYFIDDKKIIVR